MAPRGSAEISINRSDNIFNHIRPITSTPNGVWRATIWERKPETQNHERFSTAKCS